jgi:hypothetical protein
MFTPPNPRLGHAASIVRRANPRRQIMPAVGYGLEPCPTNAVEDEDENDWRQTQMRTLTEPFDLLQHSFGNLPNLAGGQER